MAKLFINAVCRHDAETVASKIATHFSVIKIGFFIIKQKSAIIIV